jgi:probable F420-dependent oxidoreductase
MKLGVFLPTYLLPGQNEHGRQIRRFAEKAEELGFDSLFATDHLLTARRFYRVSWTEPLNTLSFAAAVTERVKLGTSILVLPTHNPVVLAKEIATLQDLSGDRFIYGVGTGWYPPEFEATGGSIRQRGQRADEVLDASLALLRGPEASYHGMYHHFDKITVEPRRMLPPVWTAGGRQFAHESSPDSNAMSPRVLKRICRWDGWIARPTSTPDQTALDLAEIDEELARQGTSRREKRFTVAHENFCWLSEKSIHDDAIADQKEHMLGVVSEERPWDYIENVYLTGTVEKIQQRIQSRIDAGIEYMFLHTLTADHRQLELFARHILEPFADVTPCGSQVQT